MSIIRVDAPKKENLSFSSMISLPDSKDMLNLSFKVDGTLKYLSKSRKIVSKYQIKI